MHPVVNVFRRFRQFKRDNLFEMDTHQIVALLIAERDRLTKAIEALQGPTKRRGRPPKNPTSPAPAVAPSSEQNKRRGWSAASKKAQAAKMKAYWAAKKKAQ